MQNMSSNELTVNSICSVCHNVSVLSRNTGLNLFATKDFRDFFVANVFSESTQNVKSKNFM